MSPLAVKSLSINNTTKHASSSILTGIEMYLVIPRQNSMSSFKPIFSSRDEDVAEVDTPSDEKAATSLDNVVHSVVDNSFEGEYMDMGIPSAVHNKNERLGKLISSPTVRSD